jgi:hypothetical protein
VRCGGNNIFGTFKVYNPNIIQFVIFWHENGDSVKDQIAEALKSPKLRHPRRDEITIFEDDQYLLLEIPFSMTKNSIKGKGENETSETQSGETRSVENHGSDTNWYELTQPEIKKQFDGFKKYNEFLVEYIKNSVPKLRHLQTYHLFQLGAKDDYWYETRIDIERLKMTDGTRERSLRELSSKTRLEMLSETLGEYSTFMANQVGGPLRNSIIVGFTRKSHDLGIDDFPKLFMLAVKIDSIYSNPNNGSAQAQVKYNKAINTFTSNFGKFLMYHTKLMAMHQIGFTEANSRAVKIKSKAQHIQREINDLIHESQESRSERKSSMMWYLQDTKNRAQKEYDEGLLYNASINFSHITELLQTVSNAIFYAKENVYHLSRSASTIEFERVNNPLTLEKTEHISLIDEFKQFSEQVTHSFESLKLDIETTQTSLRNTVDVLKTFLEGKQRQTASRSGKSLGLLTVVFACFVFIDMISNFLIYYLESTRTVEKFSETIIFMIIALWPSVLMFIILYFFFLRKIWEN